MASDKRKKKVTDAMVRADNTNKGALQGFDKFGPDWMKRALNNPNVRTKDNESVRSTSGSWMNKEVLFPTIRMRGPGLEKLSPNAAFKESVQRKDFIEFGGKDLKEARAKSKAFSIELSNEIGRRGEKEKLRKKVEALVVRTPWKK